MPASGQEQVCHCQYIGLALSRGVGKAGVLVVAHLSARGSYLQVKYPLLIFLAFACNLLCTSFPRGKGMQHTGVTGSPAVTSLGQMRQQQQLLSQGPSSSYTLVQRCLAPHRLHPQGRHSCPSPVPTPAPRQSAVGFTQLCTLSSFLFTISQSQGCLLLSLFQDCLPVC